MNTICENAPESRELEIIRGLGVKNENISEFA